MVTDRAWRGFRPEISGQRRRKVQPQPGLSRCRTVSMPMPHKSQHPQKALFSKDSYQCQFTLILFALILYDQSLSRTDNRRIIDLYRLAGHHIAAVRQAVGDFRIV